MNRHTAPEVGPGGYERADFQRLIGIHYCRQPPRQSQAGNAFSFGVE
jgi:hypothetical protein